MQQQQSADQSQQSKAQQQHQQQQQQQQLSAAMMKNGPAAVTGCGHSHYHQLQPSTSRCQTTISALQQQQPSQQSNRIMLQNLSTPPTDILQHQSLENVADTGNGSSVKMTTSSADDARSNARGIGVRNTAPSGNNTNQSPANSAYFLSGTFQRPQQMQLQHSADGPIFVNNNFSLVDRTGFYHRENQSNAPTQRNTSSRMGSTSTDSPVAMRRSIFALSDNISNNNSSSSQHLANINLESAESIQQQQQNAQRFRQQQQQQQHQMMMLMDVDGGISGVSGRATTGDSNKKSIQTGGSNLTTSTVHLQPLSNLQQQQQQQMLFMPSTAGNATFYSPTTTTGMPFLPLPYKFELPDMVTDCCPLESNNGALSVGQQQNGGSSEHRERHQRYVSGECIGMFDDSFRSYSQQQQRQQDYANGRTSASANAAHRRTVSIDSTGVIRKANSTSYGISDARTTTTTKRGGAVKSSNLGVVRPNNTSTATVLSPSSTVAGNNCSGNRIHGNHSSLSAAGHMPSIAGGLMDYSSSLDGNKPVINTPMQLSSQILVNPLETFCTVPGRLSLLSNTPKYRVSVGEVQRRINPPECLNASVLGGILRRAKSKDGGKSLRDQLKMVGLCLPTGRRKATNVSALTALVEYEAFNLAKDFHILCENEFPSKQIADYLNYKMCSLESAMEVQHRKNMLAATKTILLELIELLKMDHSPVCQSNLRPILDQSIQKQLTHFSLMTHGFGNPAIMASLTAVMNWLNDSEKLLDGKL